MADRLGLFRALRSTTKASLMPADCEPQLAAQPEEPERGKFAGWKSTELTSLWGALPVGCGAAGAARMELLDTCSLPKTGDLNYRRAIALERIRKSAWFCTCIDREGFMLLDMGGNKFL